MGMARLCQREDCNESLEGRHGNVKYCRGCAKKAFRESQRRYRESNLDKRRKSSRESTRKYRASNPDRVRKSNRKAARKYRKTPKGRATIRASRARRRATGEPTAADINALWNGKKSMACPCGCGKRMRRDRPGTWHVDHIIPIAKGGDSRPANLRLLRPECNMAKRDNLEGW